MEEILRWTPTRMRDSPSAFTPINQAQETQTAVQESRADEEGAEEIEVESPQERLA
jgi:hypothetical protein